MAQCIFCLEEKTSDQLTEEHVFPAALGGVLTVKDSVCAKCNHGFSKFEQPLAEELAPVRFLLKIKDRRGNIPEVDATAKTPTTEYEARLSENGRLRMKPIVTEIRAEGGKREFLYRYPSEQQKERLRKEAKEKGRELIEESGGEPERAEIHFGGNLEMIGAAEGLRTTAKIAYMGLTRKIGKMVTGEAFAAVRNYINTGAGEPCSRLFVNHGYLEAVQTGPHQHSIALSGRNDKSQVAAIVRLFSHLCYFVVLSDNYQGADFCDTLVYDAYRGQIDGILLAHPTAEMLQIEDVGGNPKTIWSDVGQTGTEFCKFLDQEAREYYERKRKELLNANSANANLTTSKLTERKEESFAERIRRATNDCPNSGHFVWSSKTNTASKPFGVEYSKCGKDISFKIGEQRYVVCKHHGVTLGFDW